MLLGAPLRIDYGAGCGSSVCGRKFNTALTQARLAGKTESGASPRIPVHLSVCDTTPAGAGGTRGANRHGLS